MHVEVYARASSKRKHSLGRNKRLEEQSASTLSPPHPRRTLVEVVFAGSVTRPFARVCGLVRDFDRRLLVHLSNGTHLRARLDDVIRRPIACVLGGPVFPPGLGIGGDGGQVGVAAAAFAAGEFVVRAIVARFGFDDEVAAGEGV